MREFFRNLGRRGRSEPTSGGDIPEQPQVWRPINPVTEPDLARLHAYLTVPGAVNGTVSVEGPGGTLKVDFDHRDEHGYPIRTFTASREAD